MSEAVRLLFVGDPHLGSRRPARRLDDDWVGACLDKLRQCADIARETGARMVILGDVFDRARESDLRLLSGAVGILSALPEKAIVISGNHDRAGSVLGGDTALGLLRDAGILDVFDAAAYLDLGGARLHLRPYGADLAVPPEDVRADAVNIVVSHHDLAVPPATIPGAMQPVEIAGVDLVVNGHDHTPKVPHRVGSTLYYNPGNILRVSVAQMHDEPAVTLWHLADDDPFAVSDLVAAARPRETVAKQGAWMLQRLPLRASDACAIFDMTGLQQVSGGVNALDIVQAMLQRQVVSEERFLQAFRRSAELQASGDSGLVDRIVREVMRDMGVSDAVRETVEALLEDVAE